MIVLLPNEMLEIQNEVKLYIKWDGLKPYIPSDAPENIKAKYKILTEYFAKAYADASEI